MFTYILRFTIQPGHFERARFDRLLAFCRAARIDDVMFFVECEELNQGHITPQRRRLWLSMLGRFRDELSANGITFSINPWTTLLHADRGRTLAPGQESMGLMCDRHGQYAAAQACPVSPVWRAYITELYAAYAALTPRMLWIEDDFRFHNHAPLEWGGCFCEEHMRLFSQTIGRSVSREEFVEGMLKPGDPHAYRKIWLEECRREMVENARLIANAVHAVSPNTQMGLMSSKPAVHSAEGRDWPALMEALQGEDGKPCAVRPHLPMYRECAPQLYQWNFQEITALTRPLAGEEAEFYPELDNGPFSSYAVSLAMTKLKLFSAALVESKGITLSLFNMIGTGAMYEKQYADLLRGCKPLLEKTASLSLRHHESTGVFLLTGQTTSEKLHTRQGTCMTELYPSLGFWKALLSGYGIAAAYTCDTNLSGQIVGIAGQQLRCLARDEIERLFQNNHVLLDGEAAEVLLSCGLGHLIYAQGGMWVSPDSGAHAYEEVVPAIVVDGVQGARFSSQAYCGEYFRIDYTPDAPALPLTHQNSPAGAESGPGQMLLDDRHYLFPYGHFLPETLLHQDPVQQAVFLHVLRRWGAPHVEGGANVVLQCYRYGKQTVYLLLNFSHDPVSDLRLYRPAGEQSLVLRLHDRDNPDGFPLHLDRQGDIDVLRGYTLDPLALAFLIG